MKYAFLVMKATIHDDGNIEIFEPVWVSLSRAVAYDRASKLDGGTKKDSCGYPYYEVVKVPLAE